MRCYTYSNWGNKIETSFLKFLYIDKFKTFLREHEDLNFFATGKADGVEEWLWRSMAEVNEVETDLEK